MQTSRRALHRTWRMGGGGSVLRRPPRRRCSSMSGHSQGEDPPVPHGPFGNVCVRVARLGALSRCGRALLCGVPGERG